MSLSWNANAVRGDSDGNAFESSEKKTRENMRRNAMSIENVM